MTAIYFLDDLQVGLAFQSASYVITADEIKRFAREFDPQPFHLNEAAAAETLFGGLAASGWHTAAITMRLLVQSEDSLAGGIVGTGVEIAWPRPTRPGDTLRVFSRVIEVSPSRSKPNKGIVVLRSETRNQNDEIVQVLTSRLVVSRKSGATTGS